MQVETIRDALNWTENFHRHLYDSMIHSAETTGNARSQLLLKYLAEHEKKLANVVSEIEQSGDEDALGTWIYEYLDKHPIIDHEYCDASFSELKTEQIMEIIIHQHKQVIDLYSYLNDQAEIPPTQELMEEMRSLEEHEIMVMSQSANRLEDM